MSSGSRPTITDVITMIIALAALGISAYTLYDNRITEAQNRANQQYTTAATSVDKEYSVYKSIVELAKENPSLAYLFSPTAYDYYNSKKSIQNTLIESDATTSDLLDLKYRERAIANFIFTGFEEAVQGLDLAKKSNDPQLVDLFSNNLEYFVSILCNSRLIWYWDSADDRFNRQLTKSAVDYYDNTLRNKNKVATYCSKTPDSAGIFSRLAK
jgi:hypothetical protein